MFAPLTFEIDWPAALEMPSLYSFVEWAADRVISAVSTTKRPSSPPPPYTDQSPNTYNPNHRPFGGKDEPFSSNGRRSNRKPNSIALAAAHTRGEKSSPNSSYLENKDNKSADSDRFVRSAYRARTVHWGHVSEIPKSPTHPTTPGLNEYHHRRSKGNNSAVPNLSPTSPRSGSPDCDGSPIRADLGDSYEEKRYPNSWYSRSSSPSGQTQPDIGTEYQFRGNNGLQPRHRTHVPRKTILKPPTPTDDEMLVRNLWGLAVSADERLAYMYEFLSQVLLVGDDILDSMLRVGELSMFEEATRHANRMGERQRASGFRPTKVPVPRQQAARGRELPVHAKSEGRIRRGGPGPVFTAPREMNIAEEEGEG